MTKVSENVKRATGVQRRKGSTVWHWGIKVPSDLKRLYPGQWGHRCSLETSDLRAANAKAAALRAEWLDRFQRQRDASQSAQRSTNPIKLTPALIKEACDLMSARWLESDEAQRLEGLSDQQMSAQALVIEIERGKLQRAYASGTAQPVENILPSWLRWLRWEVSDKDPLYREMVRELVKARLRTVQAIERRHAGELVDTPQEPSTVALRTSEKRSESPAGAHASEPQGTPRTLRQVYVRWKAAKVRSSTAVEACDRSLRLFEEKFGHPALPTITRALGDEFRAALLAQPLSSKTKHDRMTYIKSLLKYASQDLELIPKNPWQGLDIAHKTERRREPWTSAQLATLFGQPLFTNYALPKHTWRAGGAAAYWVPLLGLFTGARVGELCQLRVVDIKATEAGPFISINEDAEGATIKTDAGVRLVPIHPELIRLGFLEYVADVRNAGHTSLWPALRLRNGKPGGYFSNWFGSFRRNLAPPVPDFHSFRHTVRTAMTEAGISEAVQDRITGHEVRGSTGTRVYSHPKAALRHAVDAINYPGLLLQPIYRK